MPAKSYKFVFMVSEAELGLIDHLAVKMYMTRPQYLSWLARRYTENNTKKGFPPPAPSIRPRPVAVGVTMPTQQIYRTINDKYCAIPAAELMRMLVHEHAAELGVEFHWGARG